MGDINISGGQGDDKNNKNEGTARVVNREYQWFITTRNIIYYILGVIEVLLALRLLFKLLGANAGNGFVAMIYALSRPLAVPFTGIFNAIGTRGQGAQFIFEPATIIAMVIYAVIAKGLVNLIRLRLQEGDVSRIR